MNQYIYFTFDPQVEDEIFGLMENLRARPVVYPHWKVRVISTSPVDETLRDILSMHEVELIEHPATHAVQSPSLVSFLHASQIAPNHRFLIRSPYCRVCHREAAAVTQWMNSQAQFHVIRDDAIEHDTPIVPHLWGGVHARVSTLPRPLVQAVENFFKGQSRELLDPTRLAERILADVVWPRAKHWGVMRHDESPRSFDAAGTPFPAHEPDGHAHCGTVYVLEEPQERTNDDATETREEPGDSLGEHLGAEACGEAASPSCSDSDGESRQEEEEKQPEVVIDTGRRLA